MEHKTTTPLTARRKRMNIFIGFALLGLAVLLFAVTIVKVTAAWS